MTKKEIVKSIAEEMDITQVRAKILFDEFFNELEDILKRGESFTEYGFGTFFVDEQNARKGYNPATGNVMLLPKKTRVRFRPSDTLKEIVNSERG